MVVASACGDAEKPVGDARERSSFDAALRIDDPLRRAELLALALRDATPVQIDEALAAVERSFGTVRPEEAAWLALAAGRVDPARTLERVSMWPLRLRDPAANTVMEDWARRAPRAAAAWSDATSELQLDAALVQGWARADFEGALRFVDSQRADAASDARIRSLVAVLCARESEAGAASACLDSLERRRDLSPATQRRSLVAALAEVAAIDPVEAAKWLTPRIGGNELIGAVDVLAVEWQALDPAGAVGWLQSLPTRAERDAALERTLRDWRQRDPGGYARWQQGCVESNRAPAPQASPPP